MSHDGVGNVQEHLVKPTKAFIEDSAHVDVLMHHGGARARLVGLHDPVQDAVGPVKLSKKVDRAGKRWRGTATGG